MVFDGDDTHRRKSSFVSSEAPGGGRGRNSSACFIHSLLETRADNGDSDDKHRIGKAKPVDPGSSTEHDAATHSRLLTKKQLSDMALGVRDLSRRLQSVRLKLKVRRVFLLTKAHDETLIQYTREVAEWLLSEDRDVQYTV